MRYYNLNAACSLDNHSQKQDGYHLRITSVLHFVPFGKIENRPHVFMNEQAQAALGEFQA